MKHTLGPWIAADVFVNNSPNRLILRQAKYGGDVVLDLGDTEHANMANARLIAAAPELLDALRKLLFEHDAISMQHDGTIDDRWPYAARIARSAIAKAEGAA